MSNSIIEHKSLPFFTRTCTNLKQNLGQQFVHVSAYYPVVKFWQLKGEEGKISIGNRVHYTEKMFISFILPEVTFGLKKGVYYQLRILKYKLSKEPIFQSRRFHRPICCLNLLRIQTPTGASVTNHKHRCHHFTGRFGRLVRHSGNDLFRGKMSLKIDRSENRLLYIIAHRRNVRGLGRVSYID